MMDKIIELEQKFMTNGITALDFTKGLQQIKDEYMAEHAKSNLDFTIFVSANVITRLVKSKYTKMEDLHAMFAELESFYKAFPETGSDYTEVDRDTFFRDQEHIMEVHL